MAAPEAVAIRPSHTKGLRRLRQSARAYLWLALPLIVVVFVVVLPVGRVIWESFTDKSLAVPESGRLIGFENYSNLRSDSLFWASFRTNLILLLSVPITIVVGLWATSILFQQIRGSRVYELFIFIPFLPAAAATSVIFIYLLRPDGPINQLIELAGLGCCTPNWRTDPSFTSWALLGVVTWKRIGFLVLLFMARALSLDRELFEAAAVDGATYRQAFRRIALPQMRAIISFAATIGFIEVFSFTFAYIFILTRTGPGRTWNLEFYLYRALFSQLNVGLASAVAVVLLLLAGFVAILRVVETRKEGQT